MRLFITIAAFGNSIWNWSGVGVEFVDGEFGKKRSLSEIMWKGFISKIEEVPEVNIVSVSVMKTHLCILAI